MKYLLPFLCFIAQLTRALQLLLHEITSTTSSNSLLSDDTLQNAGEFSPVCPATERESSITLSSQWFVLGPFPAGMREHQMGAFPALNMLPLSSLFSLSDPVLVPSAYGKGGHVKVEEVKSIDQGKGKGNLASRVWHSVRISYPDLDWKAIRQSVGWAGIQWQALSIADLHIGGISMVLLSITLDSAAEFAVLSEEEYLNCNWDGCSKHLKWYNGDWYSYTKENQLDGSELPGHILEKEPGKYKVLVKNVYEVRIFGAVQDNEAPSAEFGLDVRIRGAGGKNGELSAITTGQFAVIPDIVDGILAGWGISFALRNYWQQSVTIQQLTIVGESGKYVDSHSSDMPLSLAPLQLRPVKLRLSPVRPIPSILRCLEVQITFQVGRDEKEIKVELPLRHIDPFPAQNLGKDPITYRYTYLDSDQTVQYALATPPRNILAGIEDSLRPAILHLHGAGVDVRLDEAQHSFLSQKKTWIIEPSGRSPWGYDWQVASHISARTALLQFSLHMYGLPKSMKDKAAKIDTSRVMITGHSNGGQGANHYANHRPDEVIGAVIGAGYISLAEYIPLTWQLGRHFNDAALNGVLRSSLNAFENNLFASNLAGLPILLKYGAIDNNVPPWHSREIASLVESWNRQGHASKKLIQISEVPEKSHWWPEFMKERDVQDAIDNEYQLPKPLDQFTLSVFNAEDSGSKQGWKIIQVEVPGRIARLEVEYVDGGYMIKVRSTHVSQMQVDFDHARRPVSPKMIYIDGKVFSIDGNRSDFKRFTFIKSHQGWSDTSSKIERSRPIGPMMRFLSSSGPIHAIVPTVCSEQVTQHYYSIALRFSTDAYLYARLDTVILYDFEAVNNSSQLANTNVLLLGGPTINRVTRIAANSQSLINFLDGSSQFKIQYRIYSEASTLLTLFPHPYAKEIDDQNPQPMTLLVHGTDSLAIERGYSLLPVRTGSLLPEWIVVDKSTLWKGYGGVVGAGWYDRDWAWSEAMSYLS